jgi:hypothetical protein
VREAFKDLLKAWGWQQVLVLLAEYPVETATKTNIALDGAPLTGRPAHARDNAGQR